MADYTKNKKLELPKSNERYDVAVANKNNMVIDSELNKLDLKNQSQDSATAQIQNSLNDHKNNTNNPHNVTKAQIGLSNVDNTSDLDKPVSNMQQASIDMSINEHNESNLSHNDIREMLLALSTRLNTLADSDDETLDQLSEIVSYIKNNKSLIDGITTNKVSVSDIINTIDLLQANTVPGKIVDALLIKEVFQSVSDGKSAIASAITDKGVTTDASSMFSVMAQNIMKIKDNSNMILSSITVSPPTKNIYQVGETLDLSGAIVIANYESTDDVTQSAIYSPVNGQELTSAGNVTISVSYTDGKITKTAETSVVVSGLKIVTWADGTDEEIVAMLNAHYSGEIDIHDYWHVGDERIVHLSAMEAGAVGETHVEQDVTMVLMHEKGKTLVNDDTVLSPSIECAFIVGQKNCLIEEGYINQTSTNSGWWGECKRRIWCNETYKNSFPITLRQIFKKHLITSTKKNNNGLTSTERVIDYFSLPSEVEIFDSIGWSIDTYDDQFTYYKTTSNRVKKNGNNGSICSYYERCPATSSNDSFCMVDTSNNLNKDYASANHGISPFGCI